MAVSFVGVNAAYQAAQRVGAGASSQAAAAAGTSEISGGKGFETALADALKNGIGTMKVGEAAATQGGAGKGDIVQVVNAVTAAELTLETVVAIRDRVISAYQDIMKMPI